jgi:hypothetical protein
MNRQIAENGYAKVGVSMGRKVKEKGGQDGSLMEKNNAGRIM